MLVKSRNAVSTSVIVIVVIAIIVIAGGSYYYYTTVSSGPKGTIGVVFDVGGRGDLSFNDMAALGADNAATQLLGCTATTKGQCEQFLQSATSDDYTKNLATLASESNPPVLIVAVGFLMQQAVNQTAKQYPNQKFAIIDSAVPGLPNVLGINFKTNEGAAVAGVIAAAVSSCYSADSNSPYKNKVGLVLGIEIPVLWTFEIGYKWGVAWAENNSQQYLGHAILNNAPVKDVVLYKYTGTFSDPATGQAEALNEFNAGAAVSYNVAGATGNGIFTAAQQKAGTSATVGPPFGIGVDSDQDWVAPGFVLASQMKRVDVGVYQAAQLALNGSFSKKATDTGGVWTLGMASGNVAISTVNDLGTFLSIAVSAGKNINQADITNKINNMRSAVTTKCGDVYAFANQLTTQIKSGQVNIPYVLTQDQVTYWRGIYG